MLTMVIERTRKFDRHNPAAECAGGRGVSYRDGSFCVVCVEGAEPTGASRLCDGRGQRNMDCVLPGAVCRRGREGWIRE